MRFGRSVFLWLPLLASPDLRSGPASSTMPAALSPPLSTPNDNRRPAGILKDGVLTVVLEAKLAEWRPNGDSLPGLLVEAFAEPGRLPETPGPFIRVPVGTEIRATIRNSLERDTLTWGVPAIISGRVGGSPVDSIVVPPGAEGEVRIVTKTTGNFSYRATLGRPLDRLFRVSGQLVGGLVVDSAGATTSPRDRVFFLMANVDSVVLGPNGNPTSARLVFAINGHSWPRTERLRATVGDTLRWRIINGNFDVHPMHLHGFYFRVDSLTGPLVAAQGQGPIGRMVVTERMSPFSAMSMQWVPERAGNWLFHCHFAAHVTPANPIAGAHESHAMRGMSGLVLGIVVNPKPGERIAGEPPRPRKQYRLLAVQDSGWVDAAPSMHFVLEERSSPDRRMDPGAGVSPPIALTRGEPVSITVVNHLNEATAVHWHGIELESYYDGVAGFGGFGSRIAPIIQPGDSFEARFTPPRAGTFIYHSHVNEPRQHRAGLVGALVVRDPGNRDSTEDRIFVFKAARTRGDSLAPLEINGDANPDTLVLKAGRSYRFRFISVTATNPNLIVLLTARPDSSLANTRDSLVTQWRPVAKDGADWPDAARVPRLARQIIGMGETYDFEISPSAKGDLRIEARTGGPNGRLFARTPIRVE